MLNLNPTVCIGSAFSWQQWWIISLKWKLFAWLDNNGAKKEVCAWMQFGLTTPLRNKTDREFSEWHKKGLMGSSLRAALWMQNLTAEYSTNLCNNSQTNQVQQPTNWFNCASNLAFIESKDSGSKYANKPKGIMDGMLGTTCLQAVKIQSGCYSVPAVRLA